MRRASSWPKPGDNGMRMKEFRDGVDDRTTRKGDIERLKRQTAAWPDMTV
jgi:hypothetical protein